MAKSAQIGETRTWSNGQKYQKTANGWVSVKSGSKGSSEQKEEPVKGKSSEESKDQKQDYQIKQGEWNEDIPIKNLPYGKGDASYLKEKFPDAKVSAYIDDENEDYEVVVDIPLKDGNNINLSFYEDGMAIATYKDRDGGESERDVDIYDEEFDEILDEAGYYDEEEDGSEESSREGSNQESQQQSYTLEQLADYAKSASDEGLKRAASSGDEQMRVAAKKEIARRKNEGMENNTDNPFDKGSIQKSKKEERIYKGQVYEKIDKGWIKKK